MSSKTSSSKNHNSHKFSNFSQKANNDNSSRNKSHQKENTSCKVNTKSHQGNNNDDAKSASVMSNISSYSLIDDDQIDDQETINVGILINDLESDLEKEKIENEQANAKSTQCTNSTNALSSTSSNSFSARASSSTNAGVLLTPKSNQKSSKHSINSSSNNNNGACVISNNTTIGSADIKNGHGINPKTVFKTSNDERGELKMRITRETKPGKSEHKIVTSPNQKSPTSSSNNNVSTLSQSNCEEAYMHESNSDPTQSSSNISSTKECGTSTSIGTITEPDCLGPCEPGTSVNLEGIVWQETDGGILVVNVTWRGKTYVGALLDCTKHDWAPPRLCDSPASDIDLKAHKGVRTKRIVTRSNGIGLDEKNLLQTTGKLRNGKGRRILPNDTTPSGTKKQKENDKSNENIPAQAEANCSLAGTPTITSSETASVPMNIDTTQVTNNETISTSNISLDKAGPNSPMLIGCNEPNCSKKYRNMNGLLYHQAHAHPTDQEASNQLDGEPSPRKEKSKSSDISDQQDTPMDDEPERRSPEDVETKSSHNVRQQLHKHDARDTPSPQLRVGNKSSMGPLPGDNGQFAPEHRTVKSGDAERRDSMNSSHDSSVRNTDTGHESPGTSRPQHHHHHHHHSHELGPSSNHHSTSSNKFGLMGNIGGGSSKQSSQAPLPPSQPPPLPATTEEGMKPSGTSTGPPPAPHQANCYFNPAFLNNAFNPYSLPPYFPRQMYDPLTPPTPVSSAAFLNRFMSNVRVPPPSESPSRLLSPSTLAKGLPPPPPFPPFKLDSGSMPPLPQLSGAPPLPNPPIPGMPSMMNPPLPGGSPHLRMPSQGDPLLPPASQSPFLPPAGLNPTLGSSQAFREHFSRG